MYKSYHNQYLQNTHLTKLTIRSMPLETFLKTTGILISVSVSLGILAHTLCRSFYKSDFLFFQRRTTKQSFDAFPTLCTYFITQSSKKLSKTPPKPMNSTKRNVLNYSDLRRTIACSLLYVCRSCMFQQVCWMLYSCLATCSRLHLDTCSPATCRVLSSGFQVEFTGVLWL